MQKELTQIINHSKENFELAIMMPAYNHELFIKQAIEGVLIQQTSYSYRLFILDDCSTDTTFNVCKYYTNLYPDKISLYKNEVNLGAYKSGEIMRQVCFSSNAKYLAFCEGDDYWTDPNKIQKQIGFLEVNLDYAICFHAINILNDGVEKPSSLNPSSKEKTYSIIDLAKTNIINTSSVLFRNKLIEEFPLWFNSASAPDYILHMLNAKKGLIKYFPQVMAVYRIHAGGIWSQKDANYKFEIWLNLLELLLKEDFDFPVLQVLTQQKNKTLNELIESLLRENAYDKIKQTIYKFCEGSVSTDILPITDMLIGRINELENHVAGVKSTRTYKIAKKISALKQNIYK